MESRTQLVRSLLSDPRLDGFLSPSPTFGELQAALRRFGEPRFLLQGELSTCLVGLGDGTVIASTVTSRSNPAAAALSCLIDLLDQQRDFNSALLLGRVLAGGSR